METWRTLSLAGHIFVVDFYRMGCIIDGSVDSFLKGGRLGDGSEVELALVSPEALGELSSLGSGYVRSIAHDDMIARVQALDLKECSPFAGLKLRLEYRDQPPGEILYVPTEAGIFALENFDKVPSLFLFPNYDLEKNYNGVTEYPRECKFVFQK